VNLFYVLLSKIKSRFQLIRTIIGLIDFPHFINLDFQLQKNLLFLISKFGGRSVVINDLVKVKKSDKVFILGCGDSINKMKSSKFDHIRIHNSISIGPWMYHNFIPDIFTLELSNRFDVEFSKQERFLLKRLESCRASYSSTIFLLKSRIPHDSITNRIYKTISTRYNFKWVDTRIIFSETKFNLTLTIFILNLFKCFDCKTRFIQYQGSLIWSILIAYKMGFKEIILCGIDLKGNYFFDQGQKPTEKDHSSLIKSRSSLNLIESVLTFEKYLLRKRGVKLLINSENLAFIGKLPKYQGWS
jgi:uncharacterized Rossmann fold enzyme